LEKGDLGGFEFDLLQKIPPRPLFQRGVNAWQEISADQMKKRGKA
jgi:hypothetical protein